MRRGIIELIRRVYSNTKFNRRWFATASTSKRTCYYDLLGLSKGATTDDIRRKFFEMAKIHHPDVSSDPESTRIFQNLSEAYCVLTNSEMRNDYDKLMGYDLKSESADSRSERAFTDEEILSNLHDRYKVDTEKKNSDLFDNYFKAKYLRRDWGLKDPTHHMNFYGEMYDQKVQNDKIAAEVR
jgi:DnaJ-class molecular chaperone